MSRVIFCQKLQKEAEGLEKQPLPGDVGKQIFESISKEAWQMWVERQTMLINEHHLSLIDPKARKLLMDEMKKFLFEGVDTAPSGYVPPK